MANCPKCNKPIPWYKSVTHTRWSGVKCSHCGIKSFIRKRDLLLYPLLSGILGGAVGIFASILIGSVSRHQFSLLIGLSITIFAGLFYYFAIGWNKTKLEIRDKF